MVLLRTETGWAVRAPAKLNLYLEVLGRRDDGYHALEMLNVPVRYCDELHLCSMPATILSDRFHLRLDGDASVMANVPEGPDNLALRAVSLLAKRSGYEGGAAITLRKRIPSMAGLGGGSSDAAAAILAANAAWSLHWTTERLTEIAAEIGSDVPFFLAGSSAICSGRGEIVEPVALPAGLPCVIVQPPVGLATPQVYSQLDLSSPPDPRASAQRLEQLVAALRSGDWRGLAHGLQNRLQAAAARVSPWVERLAAAFGRLPFIAHQLTGSGAAHFGLCRNDRQARALGATLAAQRLGEVIVTRTCR